MQSELEEQASNSLHLRGVHSQECDGRSPGRRTPFDPQAVRRPAKVIRPRLRARVEDGGCGRTRSDVGGGVLGTIAPGA